MGQALSRDRQSWGNPGPKKAIFPVHPMILERFFDPRKRGDRTGRAKALSLHHLPSLVPGRIP